MKTIISEIKQIMWEYVGIIRTSKGLELAIEKFKTLQSELEASKKITPQTLEVRNMLTVAMEITKAAKSRQYSLGTHSFVNNMSSRARNESRDLV